MRTCLGGEPCDGDGGAAPLCGVRHAVDQPHDGHGVLQTQGTVIRWRRAGGEPTAASWAGVPAVMVNETYQSDVCSKATRCLRC